MADDFDDEAPPAADIGIVDDALEMNGFSEPIAPPQKKKSKKLNGGVKTLNLASVVKLFVKKTVPSQSGPWKMSSEYSSTGTGFIIEGNRLLTNAHVVHRAQSILCRPQSGSKKYECTIESIALPLDLAVLKVTEETFFDTRPPLELVESGFEHLPHLDDNVTAVGFPTGGDQISVTRGVVSRITHDNSSGSLLRVQIDAAINPGNSGGAVLNEGGKVVGVASAVLRGASNIGYIIPAHVVHLFFDSTRDTNGKCTPHMKSPEHPQGYCGVASLGIRNYQSLENSTLRKYLGMKDTEGGVRVVAVDPLGTFFDETTRELLVQPDDVLLSVDGIPIGEDGTVQLPGRPSERIYFGVLVSSQLPKKPLEISLMRNSKLQTFTVQPQPRRYLCPQIDGYDAADPPLYLICGGFVFMVLTKPWLAAHQKKKRNYSHLASRCSDPLEEEGRQVVILSTVLASSINLGYHNLSGLVLHTFNGQSVFNLQHLATLIQDSSQEPLLEFRLLTHASAPLSCSNDPTSSDNNGGKKNGKDGVPAPNEVLAILDRAKCVETDPIIRKKHLIASACSPGIEFQW